MVENKQNLPAFKHILVIFESTLTQLSTFPLFVSVTFRYFHFHYSLWVPPTVSIYLNSAGLTMDFPGDHSLS